jgi:hypothetical protein
MLGKTVCWEIRIDMNGMSRPDSAILLAPEVVECALDRFCLGQVVNPQIRDTDNPSGIRFDSRRLPANQGDYHA